MSFTIRKDGIRCIPLVQATNIHERCTGFEVPTKRESRRVVPHSFHELRSDCERFLYGIDGFPEKVWTKFVKINRLTLSSSNA